MQEPRRLCRNWLDSYIEFNQDFEPPAIYQRWMGLLTLSIAAQHRVWFQEANTKIWPNLYVVLIGPSGVGKGQAMREALPFIQQLQVPISPDKVTIRKLTKTMAAGMRSEESLGSYSPYLIWAEELPSFLGLDAWQSGKIADLTSLYDCAERWESGTATQGDDVIPQPYVCMAAGATPSSLFDVLPPASVGQGFASRLIFVEANSYENRIAEKPWMPGFHDKLQKALLHDIELIGKMKGPMRFSDVARVYWNDFYLHRPPPGEEYGDERMQGFAARKPFYTKKLAVLLSMADASEGEHPMLVEAHHLERSLYLLSDIDKSMVNVYSEIAKDAVIGHYSKVIRWLAKQTGKETTRTEISQRFAYALNKDELSACLGALSDMGIVQIEQRLVGGIAGSYSRYKSIYRLVPGREHMFQGKKSIREALDDPKVKGYVA